MRTVSPRQRFWIGLLAAVAISGLYTASRLDRGWVPHDEGSLAQSAERILDGQRPHRDFDELYTGGLSYVNAASMRTLGVNMRSPRRVLFLAFLLWLPAVYYIASRFAKPGVAMATTLLCVVWSVPNYAAAMPSWYNLFLATLGTAALFRYLERPSGLRWLFLAGLCAGMSILFKLVGVFLVAAAYLFLIYDEQSRWVPAVEPSAGRQSPVPQSAKEGSRFTSYVITGGLLAFILLLTLLVSRVPGSSVYAHFMLPGALVVALLLYREWRMCPDGSPERFMRLARTAGAFTAAACVPLLLFAAPYLADSSLRSLARGLLVLPARRLEFATQALPPLWWAVFGIALLLALALDSRLRGRERTLYRVLLTVSLGVLLILTPDRRDVYLAIWRPIHHSGPLAVTAGTVMLALRGTRRSALFRSQLFLLMSVAAMVAMVQFPFSAPIYFCYTAPFVILLLLALTVRPDSGPMFGVSLGAAFYLLFGLLFMNTGFIWRMGVVFERDRQTVPLDLERGGLRVTQEDRDLYTKTTHLAQRHSRGEYLFAGPDTPELYFLTGLKNPTRTLIDFFETERRGAGQLSAMLQANAVDVVVINTEPDFSAPYDSETLAYLAGAYPNSEVAGRFVIRWRDPP